MNIEKLRCAIEEYNKMKDKGKIKEELEDEK